MEYSLYPVINGYLKLDVYIFKVESKAMPRQFWSIDESRSNEGILEINGHVFRMINGLYGDNTVSFESITQPGFYVCNRNGRIQVGFCCLLEF